MTLSGISEPGGRVTGCEEFYGFSTRPFGLTPDLRFVFQSRSHSHAFKEVTGALQRREGLVVITGEIGTGKTVLCRALLETFHEARTFLSVILDPFLGVDDLLYQVLADFGLIARDARTTHSPASEATRHQLVSTLQQFLASLIPLNAHAVIMIDEAQHLTPPVLEQIRLLSNFETDRAKLLQIVLVGQPDLETLLRQPDLRQLDQRVARRIALYPLSDDEVKEYIARRLAVASASTVPFTSDAIAAIQRISEGVPRVINTLCDRALEIGCERRLKTLDRDTIDTAAERLKLVSGTPAAMPVVPPPALARQLPPYAAPAAAAALAIVLLGVWWMGRGSPSPPAQTPAPAQSQPPPRTSVPAPAPAQSAASQPQANPPAPAAAPAPAAPSMPTPTPAAGATTSQPVPAGAPGAADAGTYRIAVAAFRTSRRATDVAGDIGALGLPVTTRLDTTGQWYQVIVGPFLTADAATNAQRVLVRQGYTDTRITPPTVER